MKRKGFTLIELLAVIVILAIIALIATPLVLNVMNDSKKGAFKDSAYGIIKAAELNYAINSGEIGQNGLKAFNFPSDTELKVNGEKPSSGSVIVYGDGKTSIAVGSGTWCAKKGRDESEVTIEEYTLDNCKISEVTPDSCFVAKEEDIITDYDVNIPKCVTYLESFYGFYDEEILTSVCNDKRDLGFGAALSLSSLINEPELSKSIFGQTIEETGFLENVKKSNGTVIRDYMCTDITDVVIPNYINEKPIAGIGAAAFNGKGLTSVTIPDSVTSIGWIAFRDNQLTSLTIPNSVTTIGGSAFGGNQLTSVTIPNSVTTIGAFAFFYNQLTSLTIPNSVTTIGEEAFSRNQLTSVTIPSSVVSIGVGAFTDNQFLDGQEFIYNRNADGTENKESLNSYGGTKRDNVVIPSGVTTIGTYAFASNQLTSVIIPSSVTTIGELAFASNQLKSVNIPNSVTTIEAWAFAENQLTSVTIPNSIITIGDNAFDSNQLTSVTIPNSVVSIGGGAFSNNPNLALTINKPADSITGSPWGASSVTWNG